MKFSFYNHIVEEENIIILYNALSGAYTAISKQIYDLLLKHQDNLQAFEHVNKKLYSSLVANGYIVPKDYDEKSVVKNFRLRQKFNEGTYQVTINPTMDCNLNCWYCYESHIKKSRLTPVLRDAIVKNIKSEYEQKKYRALSLSFFGGEPLLCTDDIIFIINELKDFVKAEEIKATLFFTTNGTLVTDKLLAAIKNYSAGFQITVEGNEQKHDSIRFFNSSRKGTYALIFKNIRKIINQDNNNVTIRINYNNETLDNSEQLLNDIIGLNSKKVSVALHRIWQEEENSIDYSKIFSFINKLQENNVSVYYMGLETKWHTCYADNYNQVVINYDGNVYKCTARDFNAANAEGVLKHDGFIEWDVNKIMKRMSCITPKICEDCNRLPSCPGICSQKIIENGEDTKCALGVNLPLRDYIIYNFNQYLMKNKTDV